MHRDLEKAYIPSCVECLRNKLSTQKPAGPFHPLPIPDERGDSVAIDFIGLLPIDENYDCILTMADHLGSSPLKIWHFYFSITGTAKMACPVTLCPATTNSLYPSFGAPSTN